MSKTDLLITWYPYPPDPTHLPPPGPCSSTHVMSKTDLLITWYPYPPDPTHLPPRTLLIYPRDEQNRFAHHVVPVPPRTLLRGMMAMRFQYSILVLVLGHQGWLIISRVLKYAAGNKKIGEFTRYHILYIIYI